MRRHKIPRFIRYFLLNFQKKRNLIRKPIIYIERKTNIPLYRYAILKPAVSFHAFNELFD